MSDQINPSTVNTTLGAGIHVSFDSDLWDNAVASQVLIVPYVGSKDGYRYLQAVVEDGRDYGVQVLEREEAALQKLTDDLESLASAHTIMEETVTLKMEFVKDLLKKDAWNEDEITNAMDSLHDVESKHEAGRLGHQLIRNQFDAGMAYATQCSRLVKCFFVLQKIVDHLNLLHNTFGKDYQTNHHAVRALTVSMKCIDATWRKMRNIRVAMEAAKKECVAVSEHSFSVAEFEARIRV